MDPTPYRALRRKRTISALVRRALDRASGCAGAGLLRMVFGPSGRETTQHLATAKLQTFAPCFFPHGLS